MTTIKSHFIFHRGRAGDDPLTIAGVPEPRHYIDPQHLSEITYHGKPQSSQETLARQLALLNMNLPGVADVLGAKFVIGGEWSEPDVAAKALEKKTARRKLGLDYTDEDYTRSYVEGHQIAARFRAESDPLFRQVLVKLSQEGAMPVQDPPRVRNFGPLEGRPRATGEPGEIDGENILGKIQQSLGDYYATKEGGVATTDTTVLAGDVRVEKITGKPDEIETQIRLGIQTFTETYGRPGKNQEERIKNEFNTTAVGNAVADPRISIFLVYIGAEPVGFLKLWKEDYAGDVDALRLEKIQLLRSSQGRGIGRALISIAEGVARDEGKRRIVLGVDPKNVGSIKFQERLGFVSAGEEDYIIGERVVKNRRFIKEVSADADATNVPVDVPPFPLLASQEKLTRPEFLKLIEEGFEYTVTTDPKRQDVLPSFSPISLKHEDGTETPTQIELNQEREKNLNGVADQFTEECRIQCRKEGEPTLKEAWEREVSSGELEIGRKQAKTLRRLIQKKQGAAVCSNFNIAMALNVLKLFRPRKWLDISSGWGDRLAAAIAYTQLSGGEFEAYLGTDPNECLQGGYRGMIDELAAPADRGTSKYRVIADGFVEADLGPEGVWDLVFSSPPFFTVEAYSSADADTLRKFPDIRSWKEGFLFPMLAKSQAMLREGGYLVLQIEDRPEYPYIQDMKDRAVEIGLENMGSLQYQYPDEAFGKQQKRPRELFVFRKSAGTVAAAPAPAEEPVPVLDAEEVPDVEEVRGIPRYAFVDRDQRRPTKPLGKKKANLMKELTGAVVGSITPMEPGDRVAILLMGHPGAGKTGRTGEALMNALQENGVLSLRHMGNIVRIDPDFVKGEMPDQKASFGMERREGDPAGEILVSKNQDKATQYLPQVDALQSDALKEGRSVLLEAVCSNVDICVGRIQEAKRAGYRVVVGVVHREDAEEVLRDIERRAAQTGRYVGEAQFRRTHGANLKNYEAIVAEGAPDYTAVGLVREGSSDVGVLVLPKSRGVSKAEGVVVATVENYLVERERGPVEGAVATLVERVRTKDGTECMVDLGSGFAFNLLTGDQLGFQDRRANEILQDVRHPEIERMDVGGEVEPMEELVAAAGGAAELEGAEKRQIVTRIREMVLGDGSTAQFIEYLFKLNATGTMIEFPREADIGDYVEGGADVVRVDLGPELVLLVVGKFTDEDVGEDMVRQSKRDLMERGIWGVMDDLSPRGELKPEGISGRTTIQNIPISVEMVQTLKSTRSRVEMEIGVGELREPLSLQHGTSNEVIDIITKGRLGLRETSEGMLGPAVYLGSIQKASRFAARGQQKREIREGSVIRTYAFPRNMVEYPEAGRLTRLPEESAKDFAFREIADHEATWKDRGFDAVHVGASVRTQGKTREGKNIMPLRNGEWALVAGIVRNTSQAPLDMETIDEGDYNPLQRDQQIMEV